MLMHHNRSRTLPPLAVCLALLAAAGGGLRAEPVAGDTKAQAEPLQTHATETIEACMAKWDAGTHMSKEQWRETCQRIKDEREPYVRGR
jgi:hypothetical protein